MEFFLLIITFVIVLVGIAYIYGKDLAKKTINIFVFVPIIIGVGCLFIILLNKIFGWFTNYVSVLIRNTNWNYVAIGIIVIACVIAYLLNKEEKEEERKKNIQQEEHKKNK